MLSLNRGLVLALLCASLLGALSVAAEVGEAEVSGSGQVKDSSSNAGSRQQEDKSKVDAALKLAEKMKWEPNYDPAEVFCGKYDCYSILGFDESDPNTVVDKKSVSKMYRTLSRVYHPDKYRGDADEAKKRFLYIQKAEETLANETRRAEYDDVRTPDADGRDPLGKYHAKYGVKANVRYAPQTNAAVVLAVFILALHWITWVYKKNKYDTLVKDCNLDKLKAGRNQWVMVGGAAKGNKGRGQEREGVPVQKFISIPDDKPWPEGRLELCAAIDKCIEACADSSIQPSTGPVDPSLVKHFEAFKASGAKLSPEQIRKERRDHCFEPFAKALVRKVYPEFTPPGFRSPRFPDDLFGYIFVKWLVRFPQDAFVFFSRREKPTATPPADAPNTVSSPKS